MDEVILKLNAEDMQILNAGVGELPVKVAIGLINKINQQIKEQMPKPATTEEEPTKLKAV